MAIHFQLLSSACSYFPTDQPTKNSKKKDKKSQGHEHPWCTSYVPGKTLGALYKLSHLTLTAPCEKGIIITISLKKWAQKGEVCRTRMPAQAFLGSWQVSLSIQQCPCPLKSSQRLARWPPQIWELPARTSWINWSHKKVQVCLWLQKMTLLIRLKSHLKTSPERIFFSTELSLVEWMTCPPATPNLVPTSFRLIGNKPIWSSRDLRPERRDTGWQSGEVTVTSFCSITLSSLISHIPSLLFHRLLVSKFLIQHILQTSRVLTEAQTDLCVNPRPLHLDMILNFSRSHFLHL